MAQSNFTLAMHIGATVRQSFKSAIRGSQSQLNTLGSSIEQLKKQQRAIQSFELAETGVGKARVEYQRAVKEMNKYRRAVAANGPPTKQLAKHLQTAEARVLRLSNKLATQRERLRKTRRALNETGVSTHNLLADNARLGRSLDTLRGKYTKLSLAIKKSEANKAKRADLRAQIFDVAALGATVVAPLTIAIDFEQSMAKLGAITRNTDNAEVMATFNTTARRLGKSTQFTSSDVASAMTFLGMAGFEAQKITEAIPGILDLALAGDSDLATTSDIASNILSGFSLQADQMGRVGDVLTATFTTSNTHLSMLGETMKFVAPVAAATGASIEDVAAMAGLLGDAGIQGSRAGTALRATFLRLSAPTGKARDTLAELGIDVQDMEGNLRPVPVLLQEIADATKDLGSAQRAAAVKEIFGEEAASGVTKLLENAQQGQLTDFITRLNNANGRANRVAKEMSNTTKGELKRLGSALESVAISVGSLLLPAIATTAEVFASMATTVTDFANAFPFVTTVVVGGVVGLTALKAVVVAGTFALTFLKGAWLSLGAAFHVVSAAMALVKLGMVRLNILSALSAVRMGMMTAAQWALNIALTANPIGLVIAAVAAFVGMAFAVVKYWEPISEFFIGLWDSIGAATKNAVTWLLGHINLLLNPFAMLQKVFGVVSAWVRGESDPPKALKGVSPSGKIATAVLGGALATQPVMALPESTIDAAGKIQAVQMSQHTQNHTQVEANIIVNPSPGMDERALAEEVNKQMELRLAKTRAEQRGALHDDA